MKNVASLRSQVEEIAANSGLKLVWSFVDLESGESADIGGSEAVPAGDHNVLVQYLALADASKRDEVEWTKMYVFDERHRDDDHQGCIGCMSNGLRLSFGDFLGQTVITGDLGAHAVVREAIGDQGVDARAVIDGFLRASGLDGLDGRSDSSIASPTSVNIGTTTMDEQIALLRGIVGDTSEVGARTTKVLSSVLKGGGLERGLPGYGPYKTKIAHFARGGDKSSTVRGDAAVYFHEGEPRFLVSASIRDIPARQGVLPGIVAAEDLLRDVSRACWVAAVEERA